MEIINVPEDDLEEKKIEYVDDSYILPEHKRELIKVIKDIYRKSMPWADDQLFKCTVLHHYNDVISKIDKEAYLSEINETNVEDLF
jgi:hypothetical protein